MENKAKKYCEDNGILEVVFSVKGGTKCTSEILADFARQEIKQEQAKLRALAEGLEVQQIDLFVSRDADFMRQYGKVFAEIVKGMRAR